MTVRSRSKKVRPHDTTRTDPPSPAAGASTSTDAGSATLPLAEPAVAALADLAGVPAPDRRSRRERRGHGGDVESPRSGPVAQRLFGAAGAAGSGRNPRRLATRRQG